MDIVELRREIYRHYAATGRPPQLSTSEAAALHAAHAIALDHEGAITFANPFATGPTAFRVATARADYYAICSWDALGVLAALRCDGTVETCCPDCRAPIAVHVRGGSLEPADAVVHFLVPAARWYEDLSYT